MRCRAEGEPGLGLRSSSGCFRPLRLPPSQLTARGKRQGASSFFFKVALQPSSVVASVTYVKRLLDSSGSCVPVPEGGKKRGVWAFLHEANATFLPCPLQAFKLLPELTGLKKNLESTRKIR